MEIRQLRYFVNAAKTLSFTEAARRSNVAQSTLSQQIKQLETELDVTLFHRVGKHIQLTAEGRALLIDAEKIIDDARQGLQRLADMKELKGGNVSIGLASGLGISGVLTDVLTEYNKVYPMVTLTIHQVAAPLLPNLLRRHSIDLAITFLQDDPDDDLQSTQLFGTRICAAVCEHHPLDNRPSVSMERPIIPWCCPAATSTSVRLSTRLPSDRDWSSIRLWRLTTSPTLFIWCAAAAGCRCCLM